MNNTCSLQPDSCSLCSEIIGSAYPLHTHIYINAPANRILASSKHWMVVPSIGPIVAGHLLLVPKRHYFSILEVPPNELVECENLLRETTNRLRAMYGGPIFVFEHGAEDDDLTKCGGCIDHAHLHITPGPETFHSKLNSLFDDWCRFTSLAQAKESICRGPYLLAGKVTPRHSILVRRCSGSVPSQFLRQQLAIDVGRQNSWDWTRNPSETLFTRTIYDWQRHEQISKTY